MTTSNLPREQMLKAMWRDPKEDAQLALHDVYLDYMNGVWFFCGEGATGWWIDYVFANPDTEILNFPLEAYLEALKPLLEKGGTWKLWNGRVVAINVDRDQIYCRESRQGDRRGWQVRGRHGWYDALVNNFIGAERVEEVGAIVTVQQAKDMTSEEFCAGYADRPSMASGRFAEEDPHAELKQKIEEWAKDNALINVPGYSTGRKSVRLLAESGSNVMRESRDCDTLGMRRKYVKFPSGDWDGNFLRCAVGATLIVEGERALMLPDHENLWCSACGEPVNPIDGKWHWAGSHWEHSHGGQCGHFEAWSEKPEEKPERRGEYRKGDKFDGPGCDRWGHQLVYLGANNWEYMNQCGVVIRIPTLTAEALFLHGGFEPTTKEQYVPEEQPNVHWYAAEVELRNLKATHGEVVKELDALKAWADRITEDVLCPSPCCNFTNSKNRWEHIGCSNELKAALDISEVQLGFATSERDALGSKLQIAEARIKAYAVTKVGGVPAPCNVEGEYEKMRAESISFRDDNWQLRAENDALKAELEECQARFSFPDEKSKNMIESLTSQVVLQDNTIKRLAQCLDAAGAELTDTGCNWPFYLPDGSVEMISTPEWVERRKTSAKDLAATRANNRKLRADRITAAGEKVQLRTERDALKGEYEKLTKERNEMKAELADLRSNVKNTKDAVEGAALSDAVAMIDKLKDNVSFHKSRCEWLNHQYTRELEKLSDDRDALKEHLEKANGDSQGWQANAILLESALLSISHRATDHAEKSQQAREAAGRE